jgi:alpha-tubulin suppressor-like RCC1 family protein
MHCRPGTLRVVSLTALFACSVQPVTPAPPEASPPPAAPVDPPPVAPPLPFITPPPRATLAAGGKHTCALVTGPRADAPRVKCWGGNDDGELGLGDTRSRGAKPKEMGDALPAVALPAGAPIVAVAAARGRSCALRADGALHCWGDNTGGALGLGDTLARGGEPNQLAALPAIGLPGPAASIALGEMHSCAVLADGKVACWGANNDGQLGHGDLTPGGADLPVVALGTGLAARALVAGRAHNCSLFTADATLVKCWGFGHNGSLGLADTDSRGGSPGQMGDDLPRVDLGAGFRVVALVAGSAHTCALGADHRVKCWGGNRSGQLGAGHMDSPGRKHRQSSTPAPMGDALPFVDLGTDLDVVTLAAGSSHTCAIVRRRADATTGLKCWGWNGSGALGIGLGGERGGRPDQMGDNLPFVDLGDKQEPVALALGGLHSCAVVVTRGGADTGGRVKCWGSNTDGNLGLGDTDDRGEPHQMGNALPFVDLGADVRVVLPAPAVDR